MMQCGGRIGLVYTTVPEANVLTHKIDLVLVVNVIIIVIPKQR